jgi:hypothetical protein
MKASRVACGLLLTGCPVIYLLLGGRCGGGVAFAQEISLFNGKDLAGWEGNATVWRVRDGTIVGGHLEGNPQNEFLATTNDYRNFALRFEYKIVWRDRYNAGAQFRSERIPKPANEMKGYQADIGNGLTGTLYDESRRGFLARPRPEQFKVERTNDWNRYEIRCEGPRIRLMVNGELMVEYVEKDPKIPRAGKIGLQVHGQCKQEVSYRNISIEELSNE